MTKERRLAIQMWEEIKEVIRKTKRVRLIDALFINSIKKAFAKEHNINWAHECWFCHYFRYKDDVHGEGCQRCPLSDGSSGAIFGTATGCSNNAFAKVINSKFRKTKLEACDEIIRALNGRLK